MEDKNKMKSKTIKIPIYFGKLTVITTDDFKKVNAFYNDEPQAYLTGWIVNEINEFLKQ